MIETDPAVATNLGVFLHMHIRRRLRQNHQAWPFATHAQQVTIEADPAAATNLLRHMYGLAIMLPLRQVPELLLLADMYQVWGTCGARCGGVSKLLLLADMYHVWGTRARCGGA